MKTSILTFFALVLISATAIAQTPEAFKYQTVVRNADGDALANQSVTFRMTVIVDNNDAYIEQHNAQTNEFGLATVEIGTGITAGDFGSIDWSGGNAEVEVEIDPDGGTDFVELGTSDLLAVPYALHAKTVEDKDDADADPNNEIQQLTLSGNTLSITNGNSVTLPEGGGDSADEEELAKAWANVDIFGNSTAAFDSYNVTSTTKSTTGVYIVSLNSGLFSVATDPVVLVTVNNDLAPGIGIPTYGSSPSQVTVRTYDLNGNLSDRSFNILIHGK